MASTSRPSSKSSSPAPRPTGSTARSITHRSGTTTYPIIDTVEALAWIAQQAALEVHVPQWRFVGDDPGPATRLVFDLDPGEGVKMKQLCEVAQAVRELMDDIGLTTYPLTSGSKGLHLYAPLEEPVSSRGAVVLAKRVAQQLEQAMPKLVTSTMTKKPAGRQGVPGLEPEQRFEDHHRAVFASRPRTSDGRRAAHMGRDRRSEAEASALRRGVGSRRGERRSAGGAGRRRVPTEDRLTKYRGMRDASKTPEPVPKKAPKAGNNNLFVIQEHHARRLHYDLRLERDGVLVSWAVPKNLPDTPSVNHLAVHTEDHPLEYLTFEATIPKGEYGAGKMIVWDTGTYETEKFNDIPPDGPEKGGEVIVTLHGKKIDGRYALIQTDGKNWLAHRMKEQQRPQAGDLAPMLATEGSIEKLKSTQWAFEGKWDGYRVLVDANHGQLNLRSRRGRDVTDEYPQFEALAADLADHHVILDGEAVALDESGVPSFSEMQNRARSTRVEYWAFDILHLDGRSLLRAKYSDRRRLLEALAEGGGVIVPDVLSGDGPEALEYARKHRWEGVVAKKRDSTYQAGRRSSSWIKDKIWNTQEVVIGGWRQGEGGRSSGIGALMLGIPAEGGLQFVGRVGTGFTEKELTQAQGHAQAVAHRRITVQHKASDARRQGRDVRATRTGGRGALQRADG